METGQVFKVDTATLKEMSAFYKRPESDFTKLLDREFSIAKSKVSPAVTSTEVRATAWEDGKPKRGRPRKFPRASVARLLGEMDDASLTGEAEDTATEAPQAVEAQAEVQAEESDSLDEAAEELMASTPAAAPAAESDEDDGW